MIHGTGGAVPSSPAFRTYFTVSQRPRRPSPHSNAGVKHPDAGLAHPGAGVNDPERGVNDLDFEIKQPDLPLKHPDPHLRAPGTGVDLPAFTLPLPLLLALHHAMITHLIEPLEARIAPAAVSAINLSSLDG